MQYRLIPLSKITAIPYAAAGLYARRVIEIKCGNSNHLPKGTASNLNG